jgi:hypothetical protein
MSTLSTITINDTGYLKIPSGTTAQRPTTPTVTATGLSKPIIPCSNGQQLYIPGLWEKYENLPDYLRGLIGTSSINDSDAFSITFSHAVVVYLLRNPTWAAVDTTGWTEVETGRNYITNITNISVFSRTYAAGTYTFDNYSAMYMFDFISAGTTLNVGTIRYNTDTAETEYFNGSIWVSSYGRTAASAATSAQALFDAGVRTNGIYWIKPPGQATAYKHYCNFSEGVGYMMVYKHTGGTAANPYDTWNGTGTNTAYEAIMNPYDGSNYASPFISTAWSTIAPNVARVEILDNGCLRNFINFNSASTDKFTWFAQAKIASSSFSGIAGGTYNYFSIAGDSGIGRYWFINRAYGGCAIDNGYLVVMGAISGSCLWNNYNNYQILSDERTPGRDAAYDPANVGTFANRRGALVVYVR